ncbi:hypothetical protein [Haloactinomyces albus]|uniref:Uncharacterized protein n=1 Tax=Haloactinomyces albus TaxID=1352928 RepID=A0AAE3ZCB1_9ACTN|nr:hypothetical protein [Haloactinomyces albus]MDR7302298.1 hypothetical protein [Haloactinomyces albus]
MSRTDEHPALVDRDGADDQHEAVAVRGDPLAGEHTVRKGPRRRE